MRLTWRQRLAVRAGDVLQRVRPWHALPVKLGLLCLIAIRIRLRAHNLYDPAPHDDRPVGDATAPFGRNQPLWGTPGAGPEAVADGPSPREVSRRLLARDGGFTPAPFLNLLAAAWLQFQVHDWVIHDRDVAAPRIPIPVADGDAWDGGPMSVAPTLPTAAARSAGGPPVYDNKDSHWWDGSQVYGSTAEVQRRLRSFEGGRLRLGDDGALPIDPDTKSDLTGVSDNWWTGLSLLHWLFAREHNRICEVLAEAHPRLSDQELYERARLVNSAVMAKIHTVEWTPAVVPHRTVKAAMRGNWFGLFGPLGARLLRRLTRRDVIIGIPGSAHDDHGVPYSLTEEFVAVYRMHPLMPDEVRFVAAGTGEAIGVHGLSEMVGTAAQSIADRYRACDMAASFGVGRAGAIRLHNYPDTLRHLSRSPREQAAGDSPVIDLAAIDIARDRERGVPRYNDFRRMLRLPPATSFADLAGDARAAGELAELYGDVERVDLMVGLYAERLPDGFGFSETAFHIFVLMASRRLKSDPVFTEAWGPETYTAEGLRWIEGRTMGRVLADHLPSLAPLMNDVRNPFEPWDRPCNRRTGRTDPFAPQECA